jgi:hypothetical protein
VPLLAPLPAEAAFDTMRAFLEAIAREDTRALEATLAPNATWWSLGPAGRAGATPLLNLWRERFRRLNYTQLTEQSLARQADVEVFGAADLAAMPPERRPAIADLGPRDVLLRVHVLVPRIGPERLLGDELLLWLRPIEGRRFAVQGSAEDFSIPLAKGLGAQGRALPPTGLGGFVAPQPLPPRLGQAAQPLAVAAHHQAPRRERVEVRPRPQVGLDFDDRGRPLAAGEFEGTEPPVIVHERAESLAHHPNPARSCERAATAG